jgi:hypothetical protein
MIVVSDGTWMFQTKLDGVALMALNCASVICDPPLSTPNLIRSVIPDILASSINTGVKLSLIIYNILRYKIYIYFYFSRFSKTSKYLIN